MPCETTQSAPDPDPDPDPDITIVNGTYRLGKEIGQGAFATVYRGRHIASNAEVAVKIEPPGRSSWLVHEHNVYKTLHVQGGVGIPQIRWYGEEKGHKVLVMDLLGPDLETLFNYCGRRFSYKTICMLADQMIARIEYVHRCNLIHRDIKPDNFAIGLGAQCNKLFLIDFGLARQYWNPSTKQHVPYRDGKGLVGTARYVSINVHNGVEHSRRDDLESLGYVLMYFLKGRLPWQGITGLTTKQHIEKISALKSSIPAEILGRNHPEEFARYLNYCRQLKYDQAPDYMYLRQLFIARLRRFNIKYDYEFDWQIKQKTDASSASKRCQATR